MLKLGMIFEKNKRCLIDMETGEIYAENIQEIQSFLIEHEDNYVLQIF